MRTFVEQIDAGRIVDSDDPSIVIASIDRCNILAESIDPDAARGVGNLLAWSGTLGDSLDESTPLNWSGPGMRAFDSLCDGIAGPLEEAGLTLLIQPHAHHVVGDIPMCVRFLERCDSGPFGLALSPATMMTGSMLPHADDHFTRICETLLPRCAMLMLHDVMAAPGAEDDAAVLRVPLGRGRLSRAVVRGVLDRFAAEDLGLVLSDHDLPAQRAWLELE